MQIFRVQYFSKYRHKYNKQKKIALQQYYKNILTINYVKKQGLIYNKISLKKSLNVAHRTYIYKIKKIHNYQEIYMIMRLMLDDNSKVKRAEEDLTRTISGT